MIFKGDNMHNRSSLLKKFTAAACSAVFAFAGLHIFNVGADDISRQNRLTGATLTLTGEIGMNFYLELNDTDSFDKVVLSGPDGGSTVTADTLSPETSGVYEGLYKLTYQLDPTQIDVPVRICLKKGDENIPLFSPDGSKYNADGAVFSIRDYINAVNDDDNSPSDLKALVNALDVCSKYSCAMFGNSPDPMLDDILPDITAATLDKYKFTVSGRLPQGVSVLGASLLLDSDTAFRIYLSKDPRSASIDGVSADIKQKDGMYYIEVPDITAADLDKVHKAVIGDCTIKFSALSYVHSVLKNEAALSEKLVKLARSLYAYNFAADVYFSSSAGTSPTISAADFALTDNGDDSYTFNYGGETFSAVFTPYIGGDWKIYDSYKITNRADMVIICEKLLAVNKVEGRITPCRTAKDMADEWEIHNRGYSLAKSFSMTSAAERLKDVDMDKKDQGKTFDDFLAEFLGR